MANRAGFARGHLWFGESIVKAVADAARRGLDFDIIQTLGSQALDRADQDLSNAAIAAMDELPAGRGGGALLHGSGVWRRAGQNWRRNIMKLNHVANRLDPRYFELVVEMLKVKLDFIELRRTERAIWLRQPGANVDLQFSRSDTAGRDVDKLRSQVSFLSETPKADLEELAAWALAHGMAAAVGSYSDREFFLDAPVAFVDFVIEAMTPDLADYGVSF